MDLQKLLDEYLKYQKDEVNKILADISIAKEDKNALIKKIVDIKKVVEDTQIKLQFIEDLPYTPHCSA